MNPTTLLAMAATVVMAFTATARDRTLLNVSYDPTRELTSLFGSQMAVSGARGKWGAKAAKTRQKPPKTAKNRHAELDLEKSGVFLVKFWSSFWSGFYFRTDFGPILD